MKRPFVTSKQHQFRRTLLESLEERRVMDAAGIAWEGPAIVATEELLTASAFSLEQDSDSSFGWKKFENEEELRTTIVDQAIQSYQHLFGRNVFEQNWFNSDVTPLPGLEVLNSAAEIENRIAVESDFSEVKPASVYTHSFDRTFVQTPGVDEADVVEITHAGMVYVVRDGYLKVLDTNDPSNIVETASISVGGWGHQLLMSGNRLILVAQGMLELEPDAMQPDTGRNYWLQTAIRVFSIDDASKPELVSKIAIEGFVSTARIADGKLVLVQSSDVSWLAPQIVMTDSSSDGSKVRPYPGADGSLPPMHTLIWMPEWDEFELRYETESEYLARIDSQFIENLLPNYQIATADGEILEESDIGSVSDLVVKSGDLLNVARHIVVLDVLAQKPAIVSSESLLGANHSFSYVTDESIYLVNSEWDSTEIVKLDLDDEQAGVEFEAAGSVQGVVRDSRYLDEYQGMLRVVTSGPQGWVSDGDQSANLYVLQSMEDQLQVIGQLEDIADGQQLYAAEFRGDRAVMITAEGDPMTWMPFNDPLHGIDLSDPTHPQELSQVDIPGVTTYLHWIDDSHLIGLGYVELADGWHVQVALFDVSDLSSPRMVDSWTSESVYAPNFWTGWDALAMAYDVESETLVIPIPAQQNIGIGWPVIALLEPVDILPHWTLPTKQDAFWIFGLALGSSDPLVDPTAIGGDGSSRSAIVGDHLIAVSQDVLSVYSLDDLGQATDEFLLTNPLRSDYVSTAVDQPIVISLFDNDIPVGELSGFTVSETTAGGRLVVLGNGIVEYTPTSEQLSDLIWNYTDTFVYTVTTLSGKSYQAEAVVHVWKAQKEFAGRASIELVALNDEGVALTSIAEGDEFWIEVRVQDERDVPKGVFASYVNIEFDRSGFEVVGEPEPLGDFTNGVKGQLTEAGWTNLGGFTNSMAPYESGPQAIVRFKLRAVSDANLSMKATIATGVGLETLLFGESAAVDPNNVAPGTISLPMTADDTSRTELARRDVNDDGWLTALDALLVINHLNTNGSMAVQSKLAAGEFTSDWSGYDVNTDGYVTAIDVLSIINVLNSQSDPGALRVKQQPESSASSPWIPVGEAEAHSVLAKKGGLEPTFTKPSEPFFLTDEIGDGALACAAEDGAAALVDDAIAAIASDWSGLNSRKTVWPWFE